jgi:hypothetical protein
LLGKDWKDEILDNRDSNDRILSDIRSDLITAFASGSVSVSLQGGADPIRLRPENTAHFAFKIDLTDDSIELGEIPGRKFDCAVHAKQLKDFLAKCRVDRAGKSASPVDEDACRSWLLSLMQKNEVAHRKAPLREHAVRHYGVSKRTFDMIWRALAKSSPHSVPVGRPLKERKP